MRLNISKSITTVLLAIGLLASGLTANAASISMNPAAQTLPDNATFYVDILATGLPAGTTGGGLDVTWNPADMTLDSVYLATMDPADSNGGLFSGNWDPVSSAFSGTGTIGAGTLQGLFVGSFDTLSGDQAIARLNFTLSSGVTNSVINMGENLLTPGSANAWGKDTSPYTFSNVYTGATINQVAEIPVPAALWLFGSGLVGLAGVARRRGNLQTGVNLR